MTDKNHDMGGDRSDPALSKFCYETLDYYVDGIGARDIDVDMIRWCNRAKKGGCSRPESPSRQEPAFVVIEAKDFDCDPERCGTWAVELVARALGAVPILLFRDRDDLERVNPIRAEDCRLRNKDPDRVVAVTWDEFEVFCRERRDRHMRLCHSC